MRQRLAQTVWLATMLVVGACDRPAPARSNDTVPAPPPLPPPTDTVAILEAPWDPTDGPALLVVGTSASQGVVVLPSIGPNASLDTVHLDASALRGTRFDLVANGRILGQAAIGRDIPADLPDECTSWPIVQLTGASDSASRGWVVGFAAGHLTPIPFDSITGLPSSDSTKLAMDVARLASSAPADTVAQLRGIPFQVRRAYRFAIAPGVEGLVAEVLRTLNQEANPRQEHLLMIAERDSGSRGPYETAYVERTAGGEESLEATELLLTGRLGERREPVVLLARYVGDGVIYALVERLGPRRWRLRWTSPYTGC